MDRIRSGRVMLMTRIRLGNLSSDIKDVLCRRKKNNIKRRKSRREMKHIKSTKFGINA